MRTNLKGLVRTLDLRYDPAAEPAVNEYWI